MSKVIHIVHIWSKELPEWKAWCGVNKPVYFQLFWGYEPWKDKPMRDDETELTDADCYCDYCHSVYKLNEIRYKTNIIIKELEGDLVELNNT